MKIKILTLLALIVIFSIPNSTKAQWSTTGSFNTVGLSTGGNVDIAKNNDHIIFNDTMAISFIPFSHANSWFHIKHTGKNSLQFSQGGKAGQYPIMTINNAGNVLINKTTQVNSNYKLDISGLMRADGIICNTTGADFVFENDYKLRPLFEVEQFVKENNHLPEVPSAAEMQENGVQLEVLCTTLLQKVEELTLYLIEIKKENDQLKTSIEKLQSPSK
jgi:hypothetical protein